MHGQAWKAASQLAPESAGQFASLEQPGQALLLLYPCRVHRTVLINQRPQARPGHRQEHRPAISHSRKLPWHPQTTQRMMEVATR